MVEFLIESGLPSSDVLCSEAIRQGHQVHFWNNKQILTHNWEDEFHKVEMAVWGSCNTVKFMNQWTETLTDFKIFRRQHYMAYWSEHFYHGEAFSWIPLGCLLENAYYCGDNDTFGDNGLFIAPDTNDKLFKGFVAKSTVDVEDLLKEFEPETLVFISSARKIHKEWRLVIHNGKVIAHSQYKVDSQFDVDYDHYPPIQFAEEIASKPFPGLPNLYTMDIALEDDGDTYSLLEIGSANCSGIYECSVQNVVAALAKEMEKLFMNDWDK